MLPKKIDFIDFSDKNVFLIFLHILVSYSFLQAQKILNYGKNIQKWFSGFFKTATGTK